MFKSWAQFSDTVFVLIFGYSFIDLISLIMINSVSEILNMKFIGNTLVTLIGLAFGILRLIDYLAKRKIQKEINENERLVSEMKRQREEREDRLRENEIEYNKLLDNDIFKS